MALNGIIGVAIRDFRSGLHSSMPLRHVHQFYNQSELRSVAKLEKEKTVKKWKAEIPIEFLAALEQELSIEIQKITEEYIVKNEDHKSQSLSFFNNEIERLCYNFKTSVEGYFLMNPNSDTDLKEFEEFLENGKTLATSYFNHYWNCDHGNVDFFKEQSQKLKNELNHLGKEFLEKHDLLLKQEKIRKNVENIKALVLEQSRQLKEYVETFHGEVSREIFEDRVLNIHNNLQSKGKVFKEHYRKLYWALIGTLEGVVKFMPTTTTVDFVGWARKLYVTLKHVCTDDDDPEPNDRGKENRLELRRQEEENHSGRIDDAIVTVTCESNEVHVTRNCDSEDLVLAQQSESGLHFSDHDQSVSMETGDGDENESVSGNVPRTSDESIDPDQGPRPRRSKRLRQMPPEDLSQDIITVNKSKDNDNNFLLLHAIRTGKNFQTIKQILDDYGDGANVIVNGIDDDDDNGNNAAHEVIESLNHKRRSPSSALAILKLLLDKGFILINERNAKLQSPLSMALEMENVNADILECLLINGADVNENNRDGESLLFLAIRHGHGKNIIEKMLEFGADPNHVTRKRWSALHYAAYYANMSALEILIDQLNLDVNSRDNFNRTPLHFVFSRQCQFEDSLECLKLLLRKGADFSAKCNMSYVPLVRWVKGYFFEWPFKTLFEIKNVLPITEEMASSALTAMLKEVLWCRRSPFENKLHYLTQFFVFLIEEKNAKLKLRLRDEDHDQWRLQQAWRYFSGIILTSDFSNELTQRTGGSLEWKGKLNRIEGNNLGTGRLDIHTKYGSGSISVSIEMVLNCLVACENYEGFWEVCEFLKESGMIVD